MASDPPKSTLRETTPEAIAEARQLIAAAPYGALATLSPEDGYPIATRIGLAMLERMPLTLISALSAHTIALRADPRCSLLVGEVGKGDPLAHARVTLKCRAREVRPDDARRAAARTAYLSRHPKAALYVDFADFTFVVLAPESALYNAGFGRAYAIDGAALLMP